MSKSLIKNSLFYTIGNVLPQAVNFLLLPVYTAYLSPADYGIVSAMTVLSGLLGVFFSLGIERSIFRLYHDYEVQERRIFHGTVIIGLTIVSLFGSAILLAVPSLISKLFESVPYYPYYLIVILLTFLMRVVAVPTIILMVTEQARKYFFLSVGLFLLTTFLNLTLIIYLNLGAVGYLLANLTSYAIAIPFFLFFVREHVTYRFNPGYFTNIIRFSSPLIPTLLIAWIINLSDRVILEKYLSLDELGIYSLGARVGSVVSVVASGLFTAYNPFFYKIANSSKKDKTAVLVEYNYYITMLLAGLIFIVDLFSKEVFTVMLAKEYFEGVKVLPYILIGLFFGQVTGLLNLMIYQEKKTVYLMIVSFMGGCVSVICNFVLIPLIGMLGAALASIATFSIIFVLELQYAKKCFYIPFQWIRIVPTLFLLGSISVIFRVADPENLIIGIVLKSIVCISLLFFFLKKKMHKLRLIFNL